MCAANQLTGLTCVNSSFSVNHKVEAEVGGAASNVKLSGGLHVPSRKFATLGSSAVN